MLGYNKHPPWVGFSTYSEARKANYREGVTIDWTKVEPVLTSPGNETSVIFWYGIYARDYWELLHTHHAGMKAAIIAVLKDMEAVDDDHPLQMPTDRFWPFGNYIIMPTSLLRKYATFAERFMKTFARLFPNTCPFKTMEEQTKNYQLRCVGYLLERLIHIWGGLHKLNFVFAVDNIKIRLESGCAANKIHCPSGKHLYA